MLVVLTGLHCSGKRYLTHNVPQKLGFKVFNKKDIVASLCKLEGKGEDWQLWYTEEFNKNPYVMTAKIIECLPIDENVVLDAVHSNIEWDIITQLVADSVLAVFISSDGDRKQRWASEKDIFKKDAKRIGFWHTDIDRNDCLLVKIGWSFDGTASLEENEKHFRELIELQNKKKSNEFIGKSEDDDVIKTLIEENKRLTTELIKFMPVCNNCNIIKNKKNGREL